MMQKGLFMCVLLLVGCQQYAKPACAVIDIAKHTCDYITVKYIDDTGQEQVQKVPKGEIRAAAMRVK